MRKEHLDLLSEFRRDLVLVCFADGARNITRVFMFFTGDLSAVCLWAAFGFGRARLAGVLEGLVLGDAFTCRSTIRIRVIPSELLQCLAFGADILVILGIPFEDEPCRAIGPSDNGEYGTMCRRYDELCR